MHIGILTFHAAGNYGAFLQAFSLQNALNEMDDVKASIIDYICQPIEDNYQPKKYLKVKGNVAKNFLRYCLRASVMKQQRILFSAARKRHFIYDKERVSAQELSKLSYDCYIVGSDQVWNEELTGGDRTYYLNFVDDSNKKASYAVSIGNDLEHPFSEEAAGWIRDFSYICIREQKTTQNMRKMFPDRDIYCCIDPVFLTSAEKWHDFSSPMEGVQNYLLVFAMGNGKTTDPMVEYAKKYASTHNYQIVFLSDQEKWYKYRDIKHLIHVTPEQFVWLIANAEIIVTNSFHATAFSIILNRPFLVETAVKRNVRIYDLLDRFNLRQCALEQGKPVAPENSTIIWNDVNDHIRFEQKTAFNYLEKLLYHRSKET